MFFLQGLRLVQRWYSSSKHLCTIINAVSCCWTQAIFNHMSEKMADKMAAIMSGQ